MEADLDALGISRADIEPDEAEDEDEAFEVWPENWETVQVFVALGTCWRVDGFNGRWLGLDRTQIDSTLRLMRVPIARRREVFEDLLVMEAAALPVINRRAE